MLTDNECVRIYKGLHVLDHSPRITGIAMSVYAV